MTLLLCSLFLIGLLQGRVDMWYDDYYDDDEDYGYEKRKVHKASIKEELLPIAWNPSRYWEWCMSEDEKKET